MTNLDVFDMNVHLESTRRFDIPVQLDILGRDISLSSILV